MSQTFGLELGRELCQALGLDSMRVTELELRVSVHEPATLTVTQFVSGDAADAIAAVVTRYGLTAPLEEIAEEVDEP
jgi:hypothetical protein